MSKERNPQIFVAKLTSGVREKDLDYEFRRFGSIKNVQLKRGYAFIEYEDYKDAEDAIKEMDGKRFEGQRIVVQHASKIIVCNSFQWAEEEREKETEAETEATEATEAIEAIEATEAIEAIETAAETEATEMKEA